MNVFENQALLRAILIAASGVVVGLMLSLGRGLVRLIWKYKREAADVPMGELLPALAMAFTPIKRYSMHLLRRWPCRSGTCRRAISPFWQPSQAELLRLLPWCREHGRRS